MHLQSLTLKTLDLYFEVLLTVRFSKRSVETVTLLIHEGYYRSF